eukprot:523031_1
MDEGNETLTDIFKQLDGDGDGIISRHDLEEFFKATGLEATEESILNILQVAENDEGFRYGDFASVIQDCAGAYNFESLEPDSSRASMSLGSPTPLTSPLYELAKGRGSCASAEFSGDSGLLSTPLTPTAPVARRCNSWSGPSPTAVESLMQSDRPTYSISTMRAKSSSFLGRRARKSDVMRDNFVGDEMRNGAIDSTPTAVRQNSLDRRRLSLTSIADILLNVADEMEEHNKLTDSCGEKTLSRRSSIRRKSGDCRRRLSFIDGEADSSVEVNFSEIQGKSRLEHLAESLQERNNYLESEYEKHKEQSEQSNGELESIYKKLEKERANTKDMAVHAEELKNALDKKNMEMETKIEEIAEIKQKFENFQATADKNKSYLLEEQERNIKLRFERDKYFDELNEHEAERMEESRQPVDDPEKDRLIRNLTERVATLETEVMRLSPLEAECPRLHKDLDRALKTESENQKKLYELHQTFSIVRQALCADRKPTISLKHELEGKDTLAVDSPVWEHITTSAQAEQLGPSAGGFLEGRGPSDSLDTLHKSLNDHAVELMKLAYRAAMERNLEHSFLNEEFEKMQSISLSDFTSAKRQVHRTLKKFSTGGRSTEVISRISKEIHSELGKEEKQLTQRIDLKASAVKQLEEREEENETLKEEISTLTVKRELLEVENEKLEDTFRRANEL